MRNTVTFVYHLGVPHTDKDQLVRSLRKDAFMLMDHGVLKRRPDKYLKAVGEMIGELQGQKATPKDQEDLYKVLDAKGTMDRIIMANKNFMGMPSWVLSKGRLYDNAPYRTNGLRNLFPDNPCEFFLGIANPATFIPEVFASQKAKTYEEFVGDTDFLTLTWSSVIASIREANPGCAITVWSNEDTPIIWPSILQEITQVDPMVRFQGELDIVLPLLTKEGATALLHYLEERPDLTEIQRRRVRAIFLEKFYDDSVVENEIDFGGWSTGMVAEITANYEDDLEEIARMPGVNFVSV